jgi:DNA-binding response OmpR family regulator
VAKILIVDDDQNTVEMISAYLVAQAHVVESAGTGDEAMNLLSVSGYDIVILDWMLPDMDGTQVLEWYRRKATARVLMLTGKGTINDREAGLDAGADDYLIKPFSMKELAARIRALLRRPPGATNELQAGEYLLNPKTLTASRGEQTIQLPPREYALLEFLVRHPNEIFRADVLIARVWPTDSEATDNALRAVIKRIRQRLDENIIEYVAGAGYKLGG